MTDLLTRHATAAMFALILLLFGVLEPGFLAGDNLANVVKQASFIGIAATGMVFVLLTAGIDLSVGSVMYLAPLIAGIAMRALGLDPFTGMLVAVLAGLAMGAINAAFIVGLRVIPFIVTLSTLFLFRGFGIYLTDSRQFDFPEAIRGFGLSSVLGVPLPIVLFALVALAAHVTLAHTAFGRQAYALGADEEAARKAGLKTGWIKARIYMISGALAGLSGYVLIAQIGRLDVAFGEGREFDVIAAAVLGGASLFGGMGSALSAVVGATMIQLVKNGLIFAGTNLYLQPLLLGLVIFVAVVLDSLRVRRLAALRARVIRPREAGEG